MKKSKNIGKEINGFKILETQNIKGKTYYIVKCIYCENVMAKYSSSVNNGKAKCKCQYKPKVANYIDGRSKERLYAVYNGAKQRTTNPKNNLYYLYGGRGIKMCNEWLNDYNKFKEWAYSTGYDESAPRGVCTLDRINVNGNYEPNNCRWVSNIIQSQNRTTTRKIKFKGQEKCIKEWSKELNINYETLLHLINKGHSLEEIIDRK